MNYQNNKDFAEAQYYLKMLDDFCKTGRVIMPELPAQVMPWNTKEDPLKDYLVHLFNLKITIATGEEVQKFMRQVVNSKIKAKVFYDCVGKFVVECVHHIRFQRQRAWTAYHRAEDVLSWTNFKRMDRQVWHPLLNQLNQDYGADGFDKLMNQVTRNIKAKGIPESRAVQAWELMSGGWTETEFERRLNQMKIQDRYPEIKEIVAKMGRVADANGKDRLTIASGVDMKMEHSAGSDIEGITVGDDLNSLLPLELAQYSDEDMEGLFIYKYRTRRLQTFRYKSEMAKPSRKLGFTHASRKGPMIVCLDTSASMYGTPERVASTLISLLEETAEDLERDCYLIDFSVNIHAVDLMEKRRLNRMRKLGLQIPQSSDESDAEKPQRQSGASHLPFIGGGTNARKMMDEMFSLLDNDGLRYVNADVLWITDFMIPEPPRLLLDKFKEYRDTGTRFYGICIVHEQDKAENNSWEPYFHHIYTITYRPVRRY